MAESPKGFWHTAPGFITAVAALVTALAGGLGILIQSGLIGGGDGAAVDGSVATDTVAAAPSSEPGDAGLDVNAGAPASETAGPVPWDEATATLTRHDGTETEVKASTVYLACDRGQLAWKNGQKIHLDRVLSVEYEAVYREDGSADGVVTLLDGRQITDTIHTWNCPVMASNDLGRVEVPLDEVARLDFDR
jgi:hypothetical protein